MKHTVGGWPKEYDYTEPGDVLKYNKRLTRDPSLVYAQSTGSLCQGAQKCMRQNNQIDLFEEYFEGEVAEHQSENINVKTVMIFKDPNPVKRAVTKLTWHPDSSSEVRIAASYAVLRFQQMPPGMPKQSYIWNLQNPNTPEKTMDPSSPITTMAFNHKNADTIVGGSYNGSLCFFDVRKGNAQGVIKPTATTILEKSHHDPVSDVFWVTVGKQGTECVSTSTDGRLLWWDMRNLDNGPIDELELNEKIPGSDGQMTSKVLGGSCLEYHQDHPLNYLVGTEQGYIMRVNKRKNAEVNARYGIEGGKHHGPIYSIKRNPSHNKYFMSVGDWSAKIWSEDQKFPIMQTRYHSSYLTDGCWSQTRPGLFFLTRMDGFLDVWDFFYKQNEVAFSQKISDSVLTSISVMGSMCAVGDAEGTVYMQDLCRPLYDQTIQPKEKEIMFQIFEREGRREKNIEQAKKQAALKKDVKPKAENKDKIAERIEKQLNEINQTFFAAVTDN